MRPSEPNSATENPYAAPVGGWETPRLPWTWVVRRLLIVGGAVGTLFVVVSGLPYRMLFWFTAIWMMGMLIPDSRMEIPTAAISWAMVEAKDKDYQQALAAFADGAGLWFDGFFFLLPVGEPEVVECGAVAVPDAHGGVNRSRDCALRAAEHLLQESSEFREAVARRSLRVIVYDAYGSGGQRIAEFEGIDLGMSEANG